MMDQQPTALSEPQVGSIDQPGKGEAARQAGSLRKAVLDSAILELRTPLTSIKTSVTALLTIPRLESDERVQLFTIIDEETDRLICWLAKQWKKRGSMLQRGSIWRHLQLRRSSMLQEKIAGRSAHTRFKSRPL